MRPTAALILACPAAPAAARDAPGAADQPAITRHPDPVLASGAVEIHMPARIVAGPVTACCEIGASIETGGRVTRTLSSPTGTRTDPEGGRNHRDAPATGGVEILFGETDPAKSTDPAGRGAVVAMKRHAGAIGRDMPEHGRMVRHGILLAHDSAARDPAPAPSLAEIARDLKGADTPFCAMGHTDAAGSFECIMRLSRDRAASVVEAAGVGPVAPVVANARDAGRQRNRRVGPVER